MTQFGYHKSILNHHICADDISIFPGQIHSFLLVQSLLLMIIFLQYIWDLNVVVGIYIIHKYCSIWIFLNIWCPINNMYIYMYICFLNSIFCCQKSIVWCPKLQLCQPIIGITRTIKNITPFPISLYYLADNGFPKTMVDFHHPQTKTGSICSIDLCNNTVF